jgi:hypothetical protein
MAVLKARTRHQLPDSAFGLPGSRRYPMHDAAHARNALARASQMENEGRLSAGAAAQVRAKARRVLGTGGATRRRGRRGKRQ